MSANVKKLSNSQVELTITVPYADYKKAEEAAMVEVKQEVKVDGFRQGHVPDEVVREKVSEDTIRGITVEKIIPLTYAQAIQEHELQVIAQPKVDITNPVEKEGDELVYTATVAVMPEVELGNYKKIKVKRKKVEVSEKELEETMAMLMGRFAEWSDVERKAKKDDRAELDFEGFDKDGKAIENTASKNHPVVLGSNTMIPGFEEAVIDMEVGGEKEFDITFPKDYHAKAMQGQDVKFKLKLGRLEEKKDQKLDEEMVEKITGQKGSPDEFKTRVQEDLKKEMEQRAQGELDTEVVKEIVKITKTELPDSLIQDELDMLKDERKQQVSKQGLQWDQYLQHIKKTEEDFDKDHKKAAEERLLARLGVNQIIKAEKIEASDADVEKKIEEMIAQYPEDAKKNVLDHYKKGSDAYRQLKNNMAADKLINMFIEA